MRHVTDGELHAYLDGGLDALLDDRATEVRRHVDRCGTCASRLEEARTLRARAEEILGLATPGVTGAPSLEELRRLAGTPDAADAATGAGGGGEAVASTGSRPGDRRVAFGGRRGRRGLGWAATVLVALGAGWLWGITGGPGTSPSGPAPGEWGPSEGRGGLEAPSAEAESDGGATRTAADVSGAARPAEIPAASDRVQADSLAERVASSRPAPARVDEGSDAVAQATREQRRGLAPEEPLDRAAGTPSDGLPVSDETSLSDRLDVAWLPLAGVGPDGWPDVAVPDSVTALRPTEPVGADDADASRTAPGWPSLDSSGRAGRPVAEVLGLRRDVAGAMGGARMRPGRDRPTPVEALERARRTTDPSIDPGSLTVPGLEVVSVEWTRVAPETTGIRVIQRLVTGGTIELRFGGLTDGSAAPEYLLEERLPEGLRQVVVDFREGWLVARAPLEPEQIRALVALIR